MPVVIYWSTFAFSSPVPSGDWTQCLCHYSDVIYCNQFTFRGSPSHRLDQTQCVCHEPAVIYWSPFSLRGRPSQRLDQSQYVCHELAVIYWSPITFKVRLSHRLDQSNVYVINQLSFIEAHLPSRFGRPIRLEQSQYVCHELAVIYWSPITFKVRLSHRLDQSNVYVINQLSFIEAHFPLRVDRPIRLDQSQCVCHELAVVYWSLFTFWGRPSPLAWSNSMFMSWTSCYLLKNKTNHPISSNSHPMKTIYLQGSPIPSSLFKLLSQYSLVLYCRHRRSCFYDHLFAIYRYLLKDVILWIQ